MRRAAALSSDHGEADGFFPLDLLPPAAQFAERVRHLRPSLPVVLVTGDSDVVDDVLASGAVAILKPYSPDTLRRVLKEALDNRRT